MASHVILLLSLVGMFDLLGIAVNGLECYKCQNCNDPFKSSGISTIACHESCLKTKGTKDGHAGRNCGVGKKDECNKVTKDGVEYEICTCTSDKCNGVSTMKIHQILLILTAFIARKLMF
ncbi:uncharacterized protein LOC123545510 [Mercenaria mercenaria]|uniref:uncharacterized protein LOC123545510 n=1 Tax=Mercenaria mercenaria TaxID=6596 RepID=UPI00234E8C56|nr:uncharacterized protein LOC123545510 [Mercenaria mercenaria]